MSNTEPLSFPSIDPSLIHNPEPPPQSAFRSDPSIPPSQTPNISAAVPNSSIPLVEAGVKSAEQSKNPGFDNTGASNSTVPTGVQAPITSAPAANADHGTALSKPPTPRPADPNVGEGRGDITQYNEFWKAYNELADKEDAEIVKGYGSDLDTLLIFAGLFSATNTAFIIESYRDLKEDQMDTNNKLLRSLILTIHQPSSFTESYLHASNFKATARSSSTNIFFFTSLFCALFAAFGAVIGKQWLGNYEKEGQRRSPADRGLERHRKYLGLDKWYFQEVIETLPTLLQVSLLSFLLGLVQFLWNLNLPVAVVALISTVVTSAFWFIFIGIGVFFPSSPFQTRLTIILQKRFRSSGEDTKRRDATQDEITRGECVNWFMKHSTATDTLDIVAKAVVMLSETARNAINLDRVGSLIGYLLQSKLGIDGCVHLGVSTSQLQSSLVTLRDIMRSWDTSNDLVHPNDYGNRLFLQTLKHDLWELLLSPNNHGTAFKEAGVQILQKLYTEFWLAPPPWNVETWGARSLSWIEQCKAESERVWIVSRAILQGSTSGQEIPNLGRPLSLLLQSVARDNVVTLRISEKSLGVLMPILKDLLPSWNREYDPVHQTDPSNHLFSRALSHKLWCMVMNPSWQNDSSKTTISEVCDVLRLLMDVGMQPMVEALNKYIAMDSISPEHKLWCFANTYRQLRSSMPVPKDHIQCHDAVHQLLLTTLWEPEGGPDSQYLDVRLSWVLDDFDAIYPQIEESKYSLYLSKCERVLQSSWYTTLYLKSLRRLLVRDQKVWATRLMQEDHHIHLQYILYHHSFYNTVQLDCLASIFLFSKEVRSELPVLDTKSHNYLSKEWIQVIQKHLDMTNSGPGLFVAVIAIVDSPAEGVRVAIGFWRFLVAAHRLGYIDADRMKLERDSIAGYLMGRPVIIPWSFDVPDKPSESAIELHFKDLPGRYTADTYPVICDIDRSSFILSLPDIDSDVQLLSNEMLKGAVSRLRSAYTSEDLESILGSMGKIVGGPSDALIETLEKENYVETIAKLIGDKDRTDRTMAQCRDIRWWCLRLFLLMWRQRVEANPTPYTSDHCFQQIQDFFISMKEVQFGMDSSWSHRSIEEVPLTNLSPLQFMESIYTYFEFVKKNGGPDIPIAVADVYRETCGHPVISGANRSDEYQGYGGPEKWKQDVIPLVKRMETLTEGHAVLDGVPSL